MSIHILHNKGSIDAFNTNPRQIVITLTEDVDCKNITRFTEAMNRALNCWPDASPELKELGDMLNHGKILQDYYHTDTSKK